MKGESLPAVLKSEVSEFKKQDLCYESLEQKLLQRETWLEGQMKAFQFAMTGESLVLALEALVETVELSTKGEARAGFYYQPKDKEGLHLLAGMTPEYADDVRGFKIGLDSLACGLCIVTGEPVITLDVEQDPLWQPHLELARTHDFRGCWSFPVRTEGGPTLGTFAMYYRKPRVPTENELNLAKMMARTAAILISRDREQTVRAQTEAALREREEQLRKLLQIREDFIGIASHELKTPVTSIRMIAELVRFQAEKDPLAIDISLLDKLNLQISRLVRLINDLLDTKAIDERKVRYAEDAIDINALIEERTEEVMRTRPSRKLILQLGNNITVKGDRERLAQVLVNLLTNALKYSNDGTVITITSTILDNEVIVSVIDQGIGIPAASLDKIFERFYQLPTSKASAYPGMGLGLYISADIVRNHGGKLTVQSKEGEGSTFSILLPLTK